MKPSSHEFAFDLPLEPPLAESDREAYFGQLVEYARVMTPLIESAPVDEVQPLLDTLGLFAGQLEQLWPADQVPSEIRALVRAVRAGKAG